MKNPEIKYVSEGPSSYYIALAAWRRGLNVTFIKNINNYRITSPEKSLFFCNSAVMSGRNGLLTYHICKDKNKTKQLLQKNKIKIPAGKLFEHSSVKSEIISYAERLGYPVVLKSNNESGGANVFPHLKNKSQVNRALESVKANRDDFKILVEKHIEGEDYRVFVLGEEVIAAYKRIPANVIGDGERSIKSLIIDKNNQRKKNQYFEGKLLEVDSEVILNLQNQKLTVDSILPEGKMVYLQKKANLGSGGDATDVTDELPEHLKQLAVKAIQSIPDLNNGGVDILYSEGKPAEATVLEINYMAQIGGHLFPSVGNYRDVGAKMIDFYFPESIKAQSRNSEMFFNMKTIEKYFEAFPESDFTLAPSPVNETIRRTVVMHGDFKFPDIKYKIRNEARRLNLSGFIKKQNFEEIEIVLSGEEEDIGLFVEFLENGNHGIKSFEMRKYHKPIVMGFYIDS